MGAGISFFRWNCKRRQLIQNSSSPLVSSVPPASTAESEIILPESPIVQITENIVDVQEITNDEVADGIRSNGLNLITDNLSPSKYQLANVIEITPRADEDMQCGVPDTPIEFEATLYKYYCPLCMHYFKRILKTKCCNNYICLACCMDYLTSKGVERKEDITSTLNSAQFKLEKIHCPNCSTLGFQPFPVALDDMIRDYTRDNAEHRLVSARIPVAYQSSPVRRGESFEDLKRKMIPYGGSNLVGIADVITPVSTETGGGAASVVEENNEPEVVRRLEFDDLAPELPEDTTTAEVDNDGIDQLSRNVNIVAVSMMSSIFANAVHK